MKTKSIFGLMGIFALSLGLSSCSVTKKIYGLSEVEVPLTMPNNSVPQVYKDLDKAVKVVVKSQVNNSEEMYDDSNLNALTRKMLPRYTFTPSVRTFTQDATESYMQQMRFEMSTSADYSLNIDISTFKLSWIGKSSAECIVKLSYKLTNEAGEAIVPSTIVSTKVKLANSENFGNGFGRAYADALRKINWDRIADCLRVAKTAKEEKNAQVKGSGDTALEHTVIRWYVISSPQGADVSWRVISSTPEVSNTNANFVGTTPYESTESFDIKGLTYNNSGNVQIEVTCERPGYLPQRKRFNLRQAIDQKEISAKFNLIKED